MSFLTYPKYKSSGVEWLGDVPAHWEVARFKRIFREREERSLSGEEQLLSVSAYTGVRPRSELIGDADLLTRAESLEGYKLCRRSDLVINIMLAWNRGLAVTDYDGIVSPSYCVFSIVDSSSPSYLNYLVRSDEYTLYFKAHSAGVMDSRLRLYPEAFCALYCGLPPLTEQLAIADFLARETAKIDALVDEQTRMIELLKEKRQAVISHAVTKGLYPKAPMKPSGIDWLGDIPSHWQVVGLTKYLSSLVDYRGRTPTKVDDGVFLVTARNIRDGSIDYRASEDFIAESEYEAVMSRGKPAIGDVVFTTEAPLGQVANLDRPDIALAQRVIKFRGEPAVLDNYFLKYWLMGSFSQADMERLATGSTALGIKGSKVGQLRLCIPPLAEQEAIVRFISAALAALKDLSSEAEQAIELLGERRSALISAAVTGQIDVR